MNSTGRRSCRFKYYTYVITSQGLGEMQTNLNQDCWFMCRVSHVWRPEHLEVWWKQSGPNETVLAALHPSGRPFGNTLQSYRGSNVKLDRAIAQTVSRRLPGFEPGFGHVGFVVDKVELRQIFSENFGFPCQSSFHQLLHNHPYLSSGAGTIGE
jgi:hypothetical protein